MINYLKDSQEQLVMTPVNLTDNRRIVISLVHSFGGRGSPRS